MAESEVYWIIYTETNEFIVNAITQDWPELQINDRTSIQLGIWTDGDLVVDSGETYTVESGTAEFYDSVTVNGTLNVNGELVVGTANERYNEIAQYVDYGGQATVESSASNVPWYIEQLPSDARVNSIVMGFEPSSTLKSRGINGFWGILEGGSDERNNTLTNHQLSLELTEFNRYSQYGSKDAVATDLEA